MVRIISVIILCVLSLPCVRGGESDPFFAVIYPDSVDVAGSMAEVVEVELDDVADTCALDTAVAGVFHPALVKVPDDRSIYCHPYSMTFNSPDWKRMWTNTAVLASAYVGTLLVLECLPADATSWNRAEIQDVPLFKRWYNHVIRSGPEIDHDNPIFNYVLHPYAGAAYFMAARSCGFNFWRSLLYSACVSTIGWEFGIEAFMERPSIQDIFITPLVGSVIGEGFYRAKRSIVENDYHLLGSKVLGNVVVFLIDPVNEVVDLFRGRNTHCAGCLSLPGADGDMAYGSQPTRRIESSLAPVISGDYKGFSLKIMF